MRYKLGLGLGLLTSNTRRLKLWLWFIRSFGIGNNCFSFLELGLGL